ncbi:Thylakoid lumenal 17.9 kDa protein, chloroplastic [Apostasia shenzhenica]|uniref:Thylakoid lumenal 17.9 kDa protein, chloroplastic n=1 Tax=Apostasia shenzhenica TaxID=1088818 RepID=A0A2I0AN09_9ASPA|nr:Thylakoid lumenal 17.9 kDa protein, chloroplastic [Apostasia shenzhenica]
MNCNTTRSLHQFSRSWRGTKMQLILPSPPTFLWKTAQSDPTASFSLFSSSKAAAILSSLAPFAVALSLNSPLPSLASPPPDSRSFFPPATPYSQSQSLRTGLEDGKIRPCPSMNPGCISTNPKSSSFDFPMVIPEDSMENAVQRLRDAIVKTQRNAKFQIDEETPYGHYLQVEVDGGFGRDVMEFAVKGDIVAYRSMATKVTFIYPFTTALGNSDGQKDRISKLKAELGWFSPSFASMD